MRTDEGTLTNRSTPGPALHFHAVLPDAPKAVVGVLHGYADHGARYRHVMDAWADKGIASVAIDMRGHGRSGGVRGHCHRFSEFLDDAGELARLVRERAQPGVPAVVFGHSFGGLVAASYVVDRGAAPWRALVLSAPYLGLALEVPRVKIAAGKIASRIVPKLALPAGLCGADVTHDAERARAYDDDPLVFKTATARWFTEATAAQSRLLARARDLRLPLYVVMGTADRVAKVESARALFDAASSTDKTWDAREGLYHEVLSEPPWRAIADALGDWITDRSRTAEPST